MLANAGLVLGCLVLVVIAVALRIGALMAPALRPVAPSPPVRARRRTNYRRIGNVVFLKD